jgi:hypothetical protein
MSRRGAVPRVVALYGALTTLQLACFAVLIDTSFSGGGVFFMALLVFGLARRWRIAWSLLVLIDAFPLLALAGAILSNGGEMLWGNIAVMLLTGLPLEAILLSRPMRRHMGFADGPAPASPAVG